MYRLYEADTGIELGCGGDARSLAEYAVRRYPDGRAMYVLDILTYKRMFHVRGGEVTAPA